MEVGRHVGPIVLHGYGLRHLVNVQKIIQKPWIESLVGNVKTFSLKLKFWSNHVSFKWHQLPEHDTQIATFNVKILLCKNITISQEKHF